MSQWMIRVLLGLLVLHGAPLRGASAADAPKASDWVKALESPDSGESMALEDSMSSTSAWAFIEKTAEAEQKEWRSSAVSYLLGGATAIALPFLTTSSGSALRQIGVDVLMPAGMGSIILGSYRLLVDSPGMRSKTRVERGSGPSDGTMEWRLRREALSREALALRAKSARRRRTVLGAVEMGLSLGLVAFRVGDATTRALGAGTLFVISLQHLLRKNPEERASEDSVPARNPGVLSTGGWPGRGKAIWIGYSVLF